jgi:hypothetical protein
MSNFPCPFIFLIRTPLIFFFSLLLGGIKVCKWPVCFIVRCILQGQGCQIKSVSIIDLIFDQEVAETSQFDLISI